MTQIDALDKEDLLFYSYRSGRPARSQSSKVRVKHIPTGLISEAEDKSYLKARENALTGLTVMVANHNKRR